MQEKAIVVALVCLAGTPIFGQQSKEMEWTRNFSLNGPIHIGDENIDSWAPLSGSCINIEFPAASQSSSYKLTYEPYGLESAHIVLEDGRRLELAAQIVVSGVRPNYWGEQAELRFDRSANNENFSGQLCADLVEQGDLDDFMLRNVTTWVGSSKERGDEVSVVPEEPVKPIRPSVVTRAAPVAPSTPFRAVFTCGINGGHVNMMICLDGTEIKMIRNGQASVHTIYNVDRLGIDQGSGLTIRLTENFSLVAQNSSDIYVMGLKVYDSEGDVVFQDMVGRFGVISVRN